MRLVSLQRFPIPQTFRSCRPRFMAQSAGNESGKKLIRIDISSDSVCPWCFVGKKNLDRAIASAKDQYDFEVKWHPFFLDPNAPKDGVNKKEYYFRKYGPSFEQMTARMTEIFKGLGYDYSIAGLIGSTLDSHRLIYFSGQQGLDKQHNLVDEIFVGYFTQAKFIGDREFLVECARKVGVEGAVEFLEIPDNGLKEVHDELKHYSSNISGVPHFVLNGKYQLSGGQPPESFLKAFKVATDSK